MKLPDGLAQHNYLWCMRYVMLLWLYIICIIPFDLSQFDEPDDFGGTANSLQEIAKGYLSSAGLEREAAALLLSRLYMRYVKPNPPYLDLICVERIQAQAFMISLNGPHCSLQKGTIFSV